MNALLGSGVLAAGLLLGQPGSLITPPASGPNATPIQQVQAQQPSGPVVQQGSTQQPSRSLFNWFSREDRPLMSKITNWWKRDQPEVRKDGPMIVPAPKETIIRETPAIPTSKPNVTPTPSTTPSDFPRKLPNPQSKGGTIDPKVQQTSVQMTAPPNGGKYPILPAFTNKIGRDEKFEWITGQLEIENKNFVLYYATPETVDKYHGRIVILPQKNELDQFKKGDLISVRGQLTQRTTAQGTVAIYRISSAGLIERAKN